MKERRKAPKSQLEARIIASDKVIDYHAETIEKIQMKNRAQRP
jgi:hypothetical protein